MPTSSARERMVSIERLPLFDLDPAVVESSIMKNEMLLGRFDELLHCVQY